MCVMSSPRKAEVFPAFRAVDYQPLCMVYPEISTGYVGVSHLSLEFVNVDKSRHNAPTPTHPAASTETHVKKYINAKTHTLLAVELSSGIAPISLPVA